LIFRPNHHDLSLAGDELQIVSTQLRHMPPAERSHEAPVEHQDNIFGAPVIREPDRPALDVGQGKIGGNCSFGFNGCAHRYLVLIDR
jgi:hypothetical protein